MTDGKAKLHAMFTAAKAENRAVLLPYLTAGVPDPETSVALFEAMAEAGADGFEVGIPYADPLMDGPVIMSAGERALASGVTVDVALSIAASVVERTGKPVLVMTYVNPVLRNGIGTFFDRVAATGAAGVILADLPADEAAPFLAEADRCGLALALFAAPTTGAERLAAVAASEPGFVYAVAEVGVTGERSEGSSNINDLAAAIRSVSDAPIVFGVGISTPAHAAAAAQAGDGVIVGSAVVRRVLEADDASEALTAVRDYVMELVPSMRSR